MECRTTTAIRWVARVSGLLLFLFFGAFFVEHLQWFTGAQKPPLSIWLQQGAHLLLLLGFVAAWKWEGLGGVLIIGGAALFFLPLGARQMFGFFVAAIIPGILFLLCRLRGRLPVPPVEGAAGK